MHISTVLFVGRCLILFFATVTLGAGYRVTPRNDGPGSNKSSVTFSPRIRDNNAMSTETIDQMDARAAMDAIALLETHGLQIIREIRGQLPQ